MTVDWYQLFVPSGSSAELVIRGTVVYLFLWALLRFVLTREAGMMNRTDLLFIVMIADAVQNGMAGEYRSITESLVLAGTLAFWDHFLDWLSYKSKAAAKIIRGDPLPLIKEGTPNRRNLQKQLITMDELQSQMRENGLTDLAQIKMACLEPEGKISFETYEDEKKLRKT